MGSFFSKTEVTKKLTKDVYKEKRVELLNEYQDSIDNLKKKLQIKNY